RLPGGPGGAPDGTHQGPHGSPQAVSKGQPLPPRPPQARGPAPSPSRVPDQEGQRALPGRHRTARASPLDRRFRWPRRCRGRVVTGVRGRAHPPGRLLLLEQGGSAPVAETFQTTFGGRMLTIETGRLARLAGGSVTVRYGDTMVLGTASRSDPRPGLDCL